LKTHEQAGPAERKHDKATTESEDVYHEGAEQQSRNQIQDLTTETQRHRENREQRCMKSMCSYRFDANAFAT
jgi:hypothetical protein